MSWGVSTRECPECGRAHQSVRDVCVSCSSTGVSGLSDTLEAMVEKASIPNLAALFKQGKANGVLKSVADYGPATA